MSMPNEPKENVAKGKKKNRLINFRSYGLESYLALQSSE